MTKFTTAAEASMFLGGHADVPTVECYKRITAGLLFHAYAQKLEQGKFTNTYDISYRRGSVASAVYIHDRPVSTYDFLKCASRNVVASAGFFFLVDTGSSRPRQSALNLAVANGRVRSLPVVDREAVVSDGKNLSAAFVKARGMLRVNDYQLSWSGSLTSYESDVKVFGNGNSVITHQPNVVVGKLRVLDERSRFTPLMPASDLVDVGFIANKNGVFEPAERSIVGGVDIFAHDIVVRGNARYFASRPLTMTIQTIDSLTVGEVQGAMSVGPMLDTVDFNKHPINVDASLGSLPPFIERPMARMVLYETKAGVVHLRLFDGHPDSSTFPGVTPTQAVELIRGEDAIAWGCFLDPGKTAKLCMRTPERIMSLGNARYLNWATRPGEKYTWAPMTGRPTVSMITLT